MAGLPSSTVLVGLRHSLAKPTVKNEPITAVMLENMVQDCGSNPSLADV